MSPTNMNHHKNLGSIFVKTLPPNSGESKVMGFLFKGPMIIFSLYIIVFWPKEQVNIKDVHDIIDDLISTPKYSVLFAKSYTLKIEK